MGFSGAIILIFFVLLSGCTRTEYRPYDAEGKPTPNFSRTVHFKLNSDYNETPPNCVVVYPPYSNTNPKLALRIEKTIVRHLSEKVSRVISGKERKLKANLLAYDLSVPRERKEFAGSEYCEAFLEYNIYQPKNSYMLIWSERRIGLEVKLFSQTNGTEIWKAKHIARRSDGGLSFSPFGLAMNAYEANKFAMDEDIVASISEDLVRRILTTFPNIKNRDPLDIFLMQ
jgi:hypothetical protein